MKVSATLLNSISRKKLLKVQVAMSILIKIKNKKEE